MNQPEQETMNDARENSSATSSNPLLLTECVTLSNENASSSSETNSSMKPTADDKLLEKTNSVKSSNARRRRHEFLASLAIRQPCLRKNPEIDLSTDEASFNEWFCSKFKHKRNEIQKPDVPKPLVTSIADGVKKREISSVAAREQIQAALFKELSAKRRIEQAKRKAIYDQDNSVALTDGDDESEDGFSNCDDISTAGVENSNTMNNFTESGTADNSLTKIGAEEAVDLEDFGKENGSIPEVEHSDTLKGVSLISKAEQSNSLEEENDSASQLPGLLLPIRISQIILEKEGTTNTSVNSQMYALMLSTSQFETNSIKIPGGSQVSGEILALCSGGFSEQDLVGIKSSESLFSMENDDGDNFSSMIREIDSDSEDEFASRKKRRKLVFAESDEETSESTQESNGFKESESCFGDNNENIDMASISDGIADGHQSDSFDDSYNEIDGEAEDSSRNQLDEGKDLLLQENEADVISDKENNDVILDSSDDELAVCQKIKRNVEKRLRGSERKVKQKSEYIEEEASLSGDDVGSDLEDDEGPDEYEEEDGVEELPDEETIRLNVHKQWLRQQRDDEYRRLMYWKDQLLPEGDLYKETNRSFRLKLRDEAENSVDENHENEKVLTKIDDCAEDEETRRRHIEMVKWKMENRIDDCSTEVHFEDSQLLKAGATSLHSQGSCDKRYSEESNDTHKNAEIKNSLLQNRCSLSTIVNHNDNGNLLSGNTRGLYINRAIQESHSEEISSKSSFSSVQKKSFLSGML